MHTHPRDLSGSRPSDLRGPGCPCGSGIWNSRPGCLRLWGAVRRCHNGVSSTNRNLSCPSSGARVWDGVSVVPPKAGGAGETAPAAVPRLLGGQPLSVIWAVAASLQLCLVSTRFSLCLRLHGAPPHRTPLMRDQGPPAPAWLPLAQSYLQTRAGFRARAPLRPRAPCLSGRDPLPPSQRLGAEWP